MMLISVPLKLLNVILFWIMHPMKKRELGFINNVKNYEWWVFSNDIICPVAMYELRRPVFCRNSDESSCEAKNFSPKKDQIF